MFIAIGTVLGAAFGIAWIVSTPVTFEATTALELTSIAPQVNISSVGARPDPVTIDTDAQIATSDPVVRAITENSTRDAADVRANLDVAARPLTDVMTITYTAGSPAEAVDGASAAARAFLQEKDRLIVEPVRRYLTEVASEKPVVGTQGAVLALPSDDIWALETRRQAALASELRLQGAGRVVEASRITAPNDRGDVEVPLVTGAALGALLGLLLAVIAPAGVSRPVTRVRRKP